MAPRAKAKAAPVVMPQVDPALAEKAARQAGKAPKTDDPSDIVKCRVMKLGDGKVSTGQHVSGVGEVHFERGEELTIARSIALGLEDRGYVEIVEP